MSKQLKPTALGIASRQGSDTTRLRHDSGRFARNHAQPAKDVQKASKPDVLPAAEDLHKQAQSDLAELERRAKLISKG